MNILYVPKQATVYSIDSEPKLSLLDVSTAVRSGLLLQQPAEDEEESVMRLKGRHFIAKIKHTEEKRPQ